MKELKENLENIFVENENEYCDWVEYLGGTSDSLLVSEALKEMSQKRYINLLYDDKNGVAIAATNKKIREFKKFLDDENKENFDNDYSIIKITKYCSELLGSQDPSFTTITGLRFCY